MHHLLAGDLNAGLGIAKDGTADAYPFIGTSAAEQENSNGEKVREWLLDMKIVLLNTHASTGPTYNGNHGPSRIDFLGMSLASWNRWKEGIKCRTLLYEGDRLQPFRTRGQWCEHRPLVARMDVRMEFCSDQTNPCNISNDNLIRGLTEGWRAAEFVSDVTTWAHDTVNSEEWKHMLGTALVAA